MSNEYKTGDLCPKEGYWRQVETDFVAWHEVGDRFAPSIKNSFARAHYEFISDEKNK